MGNSPFAGCGNCFYPLASWNETNLAGHWAHYCILQSKMSMVVPCTAVSNMSKLVMMWVSHDCVIQTALLAWKPDVCWSHISTCFTFSLLWMKGCKIFNPIDHHSLDMFTSCMCLTHGLHLNSCGEKKLALLFAKSFSDNNVSGISSTLIIINATNSPFLAQKQKHKGT